MIIENTSPILGLGNIDISINPNKLYTIYEYKIIGDDFFGGLNITADRFVQLYIFDTDDINGIFSSPSLLDSTTTDNNNKISLVFSGSMDSTIRIIFEYDAYNNKNELEDLSVKIELRNYSLSELFNSDFYMYETKSGIPYSVHLIGSYSMLESNIPTTRTGEYYKRLGSIYEISKINPIDMLALERNASNIISSFTYEHFRPILISNLNLALTPTSMNTSLINNVQIITRRILLGYAISILERLKKESVKRPTFLNLVNQALNINTANPNFYTDLIDDVDNLLDEAIVSGLSRKALDLCEEAKDILSDPIDMSLSIPINLQSKLTTFIPYLTSLTMSEMQVSDKAHEINIVPVTVNFSITSTDEMHYKYIIKLTKTSTPSGVLDIQGDSKFTEKYSASKVLIGHFHENERGYLKRTLVTNKFGKSHKDAFVKNRSLYGKEEDYIYLDLLESTRNIFSNSNKYLRGVALLAQKQLPDPPRANIIIHFKNVDTPDIPIPGYELPLIIEDVHMYDVYAEPIIVVDANLPTERRFVLLTKNDFARIIVRQEGMNVEYTFNYTERSGNYTAKYYIEGTNIELKLADRIERKIRHDFSIIDQLRQGMAGVTNVIDDIAKTYKLDHYVITTPSKTETVIRSDKPFETVIKFNAVGREDEFEVKFYYKLITKTFKFYFIDKNTSELIDLSKDEFIQPPKNTNPLVFNNVHKIEFRPFSGIKVDNETQYTCFVPDFKNYTDLATDNTIDPIVYSIRYELVVSKLIFRYALKNNHEVQLQPEIIMEAVKVGTGYADIYLKIEEVYYKIMPKTDEEFNEELNQYTKTLISKKDIPEIIHYFEYEELKAETVQIIYEDDEGNDIGYLFTGTAAPQVFNNTGNISVSEITVPTTYMIGSNVEMRLITSVEPITIKPEDKQDDNKYRKVIKYTFERRRLSTTASINFELSTVCEYRLGVHFFLLDQNNKVRATFDLDLAKFGAGPVFYSSSYNGVNINLERRIFNTATGIDLTLAEIAAINANTEQVSGTSLKYTMSLKGTISRDLTNLLGTDSFGEPITYKLVGTNHIAVTHDHPIYIMTYSDYDVNGPITSTYGYAAGSNKHAVLDDMYNADYTLLTTLGMAAGAYTYEGGKTLLTINMNAESEETIFKFAPDTIRGISVPTVFTISVDSLKTSL